MDKLTHLGSTSTEYTFTKPSASILETFKNKHPESLYLVPFVQERDEFTSLCVAGNTNIDIARDEEKFPLGIPIKDLVGTEGIVFGYDEKTNLPVAKRYHSVRKTREQAEVVTILVDCIHTDGSGKVEYIKKEINVTPDHLVLISTGWHKTEWIEAQNIIPGARLIADQNSGDHKVLSVLKGKTQDVYNMEVEEIENFFGDGVILHNCPITNQPDHAKIEIIYVPNEDMVESKSLKLYLFSFRNNGEFHEDVINRITNDLFAIMNPKYIRVFGDFASRGGIAIKPLVEKWNPLYSLRGYSPVESSTIVRLVEMWDRKRN